MTDISITDNTNQPKSFLNRWTDKAINLLRRITRHEPTEIYFKPPAAVTAPAPTIEQLFGNRSTRKVDTIFRYDNQDFPVSVSRNPETGKISVMPNELAMTRARSKPNGVSASNGGASGVTEVATRVSQDVDSYRNGLESFAVFSPNSYWRNFALADQINLSDLKNVPLHKLGELLAVVSPEVSNGLYIRTIFSNSGYEIEALKLDKDERDERAQKELNAMRRIVARQNGTEDVFFNRLFTTYFMRGSILSELVLDENGRDFAGIVTPDPVTLKFKRVSHPTLRTVWDFGQMQNNKFVSLNVETIRYVPLNPFTDSIEGQPLISSSFFIAIFMMAVLRDFKRVVQQQGYPRYDIEIDLKELNDLIPSSADEDSPEGEAAFQRAAENLIETIKASVRDLEPDETFIHFKGVSVNSTAGATANGGITAIDGLFKGLERMAARALKVPPVLLGITDSVNETNANRQFETFLIDIGNGQHTIENVIGGQYALALQAKGIAARVKIRFAVNRAAERLRDAQADMTEAEVAIIQYNAGWISQDEAAKRGAGVDKADQDKPRTAQTVTTPSNNANTGDNTNRMPTIGDIQEARKIFQEFAPEPAQDLIFAGQKEN